MSISMPLEILVAEDSNDDALLLSIALRKGGINHSLTRLANGQEAIEYLRTKSPPDVLVLDLKMPGTDGFEVLEWLRGQPTLKNLPVIVLSGSNLETDMVRAKELGARDYFLKSADLAALVKCLHFRMSEIASEVA